MKKYLKSGFNTTQNIKLEAGTYSLVAYVKSLYGNTYTFALGYDGAQGVEWTEYDVDVVKNQLCKVWFTFTIREKITKLKPISSNFSASLPVYVADLQLTRGNVPVEAGASPLDVDEVLDGIEEEIEQVKADANTSLAKTKFMTEIDGGLIYSAMMKLHDAGGTGDEMAGISGIAGDNKEDPAFWAGGTYEQAIGGTAKAIIRHDGTSKFSDTDITGTVNATDGSFRGKVSVPFVIIDSFTSGSIINLDDSFNISTHSYMGDKTVYLPIDEKYNGVVCHIHNGGRTQNEGTFEVKIQGNQVFEGRKRGAQIQSINIGTGQIGAFICLKDISGSIGWACTNYADLQL